MSWLTNFVLPKIRAVVTKKEVPDNLWDKCPRCGQMLFHRELEANLFVCHACAFHMRLDPQRRLAMLFDDGVFTRIELPKTIVDPLRFRDRKRYADRLKEAHAKAAAGSDAIVVAHGTIGGVATVVAAFDFAFMGQMPRSILAVEEVKAAGLPYIVLLTDPTTGGVSASFAMLGDITLAEPEAVIGFAGARVIEETIREKLPEGFQRSEYLLEHGMVDLVVQRKELRQTLARIVGLLRRRTPAAEIVPLLAEAAS